METDIRHVFIHFFYQHKTDVEDAEILPLMDKTLNCEDPRHWYYYLMDYGAMLKKQGTNSNRKSAHYIRQSTFQGSDRMVRGAVIKHLIKYGAIGEQELISFMGVEPGRAGKIIASVVLQ